MHSKGLMRKSCSECEQAIPHCHRLWLTLKTALPITYIPFIVSMMVRAENDPFEMDPNRKTLYSFFSYFVCNKQDDRRITN